MLPAEFRQNSTAHCTLGDVMMRNITFFMIFAVFSVCVSPLTLV